MQGVVRKLSQNGFNEVIKEDGARGGGCSCPELRS